MPESISMRELESVVSAAERRDNMQKAIDTGLPFLRKESPNHMKTGRLSIVGYGPSLTDSWQRIRHPVIATSGAYDFLVDHGVSPKYYTVIDPRKETVQLLKKPLELTRYLMASVCHPDWWDVLKGYDVQLWHLINGDDLDTVEWVANHHPAGMDCMIGGGSTVGQRAMNLGAVMGYRQFDVFGMDGSFDEKTHAGPHWNTQQVEMWVQMGGRRFKTTPQLVQSTREIQQFLLTVDADVQFYGDGLIQEMARTIRARKTL